MGRVFAFVLLALVPACGAPPGDPDVMTVCAPSELSEAVVASGERWESVTGIRVETVASGCSLDVRIADHGDSAAALFDDGRDGGPDSLMVHPKALEYSDERLQLIVLHEMGHALTVQSQRSARDHHNVDGVMAENPWKVDHSRITYDDLGIVCAGGGRYAGCSRFEAEL